MLVGAGCSSSSTTSPTTTTATATTINEQFSGTLPVAGTAFYSFAINTAGSVTATLQGVSGAGVPPSVVLNMGIGTPAGTTCVAGSSSVQVVGSAGLSTVVTISESPGTFCVLLADPGNLFAPASFSIAITHP
jgi:hypothetical protein